MSILRAHTYANDHILCTVTIVIYIYKALCDFVCLFVFTLITRDWAAPSLHDSSCARMVLSENGNKEIGMLRFKGAYRLSALCSSNVYRLSTVAGNAVIDA